MLEHFTVAVVLATLNSKFVDVLKQPLQKAKPEWDLWWFTYVSLITGLLLGWFAQLNILGEYIPNHTAGVIITGLALGAGSWFLYEVFMDKPNTVEVKTTTQQDQPAMTTAISVSQETAAVAETVEPEGSPGMTWKPGS